MDRATNSNYKHCCSMEGRIAYARMRQTETDENKYPQARRLGLLILCMIFCLCSQAIMQVVWLVCDGRGASVVRIALAFWAGIVPTMALGLRGARHMISRQSDAMFLCKSFCWLLLLFKLASLMARLLILGIFDVVNVFVNFVWVVVICYILWGLYISRGLTAIFPRGWRDVSVADVAAAVLCGIFMVVIPTVLIDMILKM